MGVEGVGRFTFTVSDPLKRRWPKGVDEATGKDVRAGAGRPRQAGTTPAGRIAMPWRSGRLPRFSRGPG